MPPAEFSLIRNERKEQMKSVDVKFGTPEPIGFREYDSGHPLIDLDLEFRAAGISSVTACDGALYNGEEDMTSKVRETALSAIKEFVSAWPEGRSFWKKGTKAELENCIDRRLAEMGITAETRIFSFALTSESAELYNAAVKEHCEQKPFVDIIDKYKDILEGNEGQPITGRMTRPELFGRYFTPSSDDKGMKISENADSAFVGMDPPADLERMYSGANDKYCRQCGAKRENNAKFCHECGAKFDRDKR